MFPEKNTRILFKLIALFEELFLLGEARDALINMIMKNCPFDQLNWAEKMLETDSYSRLMEVASEISHPDFK